ncbi:IS3 family transposase [Microbulbifer harenosus]|uniref:IS3 family transposase n=1 Tax=Microbulbifer harenosus TaxID=2576840 RepID=UPI003BA28915
MPRYNEGFKERAVQMMMPPSAKSVAEVSRETGVSEPTLYNWRNQFREQGVAVPADPKNPEHWSGESKFAVILETAALNEAELAEYCRQKGLYVEQIQRWREAAIAGAGNRDQLSAEERRDLQKERKKARKLEKELKRKEKALAEAAALLVLQKKAPRPSGGKGGRMIASEDRQVAIELIEEAVTAGAARYKACAVLDLTVRTLQRWKRALQKGDLADHRKRAAQSRTPDNKLTAEERQRILDVCNQPEYRSLPPSQIVPALADKGIYIASESSFYRVLREADQLHRRGKAETPRSVARPKGYLAERPNQVWSWDITFLASSVRGVFYRLYLILDIFSRKIVGWEVHADESSEHASTLIRKAQLAEGVVKKGLVLHSDNGGPMKGATMLATLQKLGVVASFSRPSVSNDNPYSESLFRTLKYGPSYPSKPFESISAAREWVHGFVQWYNNMHRHSAIRFVTPSQRHSGEEVSLLERRHAVYEDAKQRNPKRWPGRTRNWNPVGGVWLNPSPEDQASQEVKLEAA